jgi:arabinose-5-phosphate isomerase
MVDIKKSRNKSLAECRRVIRIEAEAVQGLLTHLNGAVTQSLDILEACTKRGGRVILAGMGKSGLVARKIAATLSSTGTPSLFLHPAEAVHGDVGVVGSKDAIVVVSKSGRTGELDALLPAFKLLGIPIIGLLGDTKSPLAERCDVVIDVSVKEEACPFDLAPTASTTAALVMGDAMALALLHRQGFTADDFALLHPGGTLGRRLMLRLESVMRTGAEIPQVKADASLRELIMEMTTKRLGATCVLDKGKLVGIITDGDLRRLLERNVDLSNVSACDLMSAKPKTIQPEALATQAIHLMERYGITQLIITSKSGELKGIVHLHDLLKAGIQ